MSAKIKFRDELLEFDGDRIRYDGSLFTGISIEEYPGGGQKFETPYIDGFPEGLCKEWHPNGQLKHEWFALHGMKHGKSTEWHENGSVKLIAQYDRGLELEYDEWTAQGALCTSRRIDKNSTLYRAFMEWKRKNLTS
jgi:antitoxin component YwqK of YwqJK toxin-antitoxin module